MSLTQKERLLKALYQYPEGKTQKELIDLLDFPGVSKRISELREEYEIEDVPVKGKGYGRYVLRGKIAQLVADQARKPTHQGHIELYKCEKGHITSFYGHDPERDSVPCGHTGCNYRVQAMRVG